MKYSVIAQFLLLLFFLSCDEEVNRPAFQTQEVTELNDQGVTYNAKISVIGNSSIDSYGFVWATHLAPDLTDSVYYFSKIAAPGQFTLRISDALVANEQYYVRSFIKTHQQVFYGNTVKFKSLGSATPVINDFSPKAGFGLEKITITGQHFSEILSNNTVTIGTVQCAIISASRDQLVVQIPKEYVTGSYPISITVAGKTAKTTTNFMLKGPLVESISPTSGPAGTVLTINGSGFATSTADNAVFFDGGTVLITNASANQLTVIVPANPTAGLKQISVTLNDATGISPTPFTLTGPTITSFSPAAGVQGSEVVINGSGFSNVPEENTVTMGLYAYAQVISATPEQLVVTVPTAMEAGDVHITVTVKSIFTAADQKFTIEGPEITSFTPDAEYGGNTITLFGKNFDVNGNNFVSFDRLEAAVINHSATTLTVQVPFNLTRSCPIKIRVGLIEYQTPINFTLLSPWQKQVNFPGARRYGATSFTVGSYGYVAMGISESGDRKDVWQFNPSDNSWVRKADYPGPTRAFSFSFVVNGKAYVGGGGHYGGSIYNKISTYYDLWEYDPATDTWTEKQGFSPNGLSNIELVATAIGSYGYFIANRFLYRYDPAANQWFVFNSVPSDARVALTVGDKGYFGFGVSSNTFWEFTPATNTWTQLPDCPAYYGFGGPVNFVINNKIYVGASNGFYEFDPATSQWKQYPAMPEGAGYPGVFSINNAGYVATGLYNEPLGLFYKFIPNY